MEIAVAVNEIAEIKGLYKSKPTTIDKICIIAPKARTKIELDDLFVKNMASGIIPRLMIRIKPGTIPVKIVPYTLVNSRSSGVGVIGKYIPGIKKSVTYHKIAIMLPIISRFALLSVLSFLIKVLPTKNKIKEIRTIMSGMKGSRK